MHLRQFSNEYLNKGKFNLNSSITGGQFPRKNVKNILGFMNYNGYMKCGYIFQRVRSRQLLLLTKKAWKPHVNAKQKNQHKNSSSSRPKTPSQYININKPILRKSLSYLKVVPLRSKSAKRHSRLPSWLIVKSSRKCNPREISRKHQYNLILKH